MRNRICVFAFIMSIVVAIFIIIEFTNPVCSLALVVSMVALSVAGFGCALKGIRNDRTPLSVAVLIFSSFVMIMLLLIFLIWIIMGMGA